MVTPVRKVELFCKAAKTRNIIRLYKHCQITWKSNNSKNKLVWFQAMRMWDFVIGPVEKIKQGEAVRVRVEFTYQPIDLTGIKFLERRPKGAGRKYKGPIPEPRRAFCNPIVICEKAPFTPDLKGKWGVNPISFMKLTDINNESEP